MGEGLIEAGWVTCKAYVTKRIKPLIADGKPTHVIGVPLHWGSRAKPARASAQIRLMPSVGDANTQTLEFKAFLVNIERATGPAVSEGDHDGRSPDSELHPTLGDDP